MAAFPEILREIAAECEDPTPWIATSAGCDSNAVLLALLDVGKRPTITSFALDNERSRDSIAAQENARRLGLDFHLVTLPSDPLELAGHIKESIRLGVRGKANLEAMTPMRLVIEEVAGLGARTLWTGLLADAHFGVTKSELIRYRDADVETFDEYRRGYFAGAGARQVGWLTSFATPLGVTIRAPFFDTRVREHFLGRTWAELNKPQQKGPVRAYPGLSGLDVDRVRSNLQCARNGVRDTLAGLLDGPETNPYGYRSMTGVYGAWAREIEKETMA